MGRIALLPVYGRRLLLDNILFSLCQSSGSYYDDYFFHTTVLVMDVPGELMSRLVR